MANTNTGYKGISRRRNSGKYETRVEVKDGSMRNRYYVGLFNTLDEAISERVKFITKLI